MDNSPPCEHGAEVANNLTRIRENEKKNSEEQVGLAFEKFSRSFAKDSPLKRAFGDYNDVEGNNWQAPSSMKRAFERGESLEESVAEDVDSRNVKRKKKSNLELFKEELKHRHLEQAKRAGRSGTGLVKESLGKICSVFIGNLHPLLSEKDLCQIFGAFGPIGTVKVMWPRTAEEFERQHNVGFVSFINKADAIDAMKFLDKKVIMKRQVRVTWSKSVDMPAKPLQERESYPRSKAVLPSGLPFSAQPFTAALESAHEEAPNCKVNMKDCYVQVRIPEDRYLLKVIHFAISQILKYGPEFELAILNIEKQNDNSQLRFMHDIRCEGHIYYKWKLYSLLQGDHVNSWSSADFRIFADGPLWKPPQSGTPKVQSTLESKIRKVLGCILSKLTLERSVVGSAMAFCINNASFYLNIVDVIHKSFYDTQHLPPIQVAKLFLISDIVNNSTSNVKNSSNYRTQFADCLESIFTALNRTLHSISARMRAEVYKKHILNVLNSWSDIFLYDQAFLHKLKSIFFANKPNTENLSKKAYVTKENTLLTDKGKECVTIPGRPALPNETKEQFSALRGAKPHCPDGRGSNAPLNDEDIDGEDIDGEDIGGDDIDGEDLDGDDIDGEDL
eukprot:Nk52_evm27s1992 gene=Nk52_evmTU27s1992